MRDLVVAMLVLIGVSIVADSSIASEIFEGVTKPVSNLDLSVPVDGVVLELFVTEGQHVKKGDPLLRLDDRMPAFEVKRRKELLRDNARYKSSKYNRDIVESLLQSAKELQQTTGSVSDDEIKRLDMQFSTVDGEVRALEYAKKREQLELDTARADLERHTLISPIDGIVTDIYLDVGEWAKLGEVAVKVVDPSICYLEVNVEERRVRQLIELSDVSLFVNVGDRVLEKQAKVVFVSPVADQASGLVRVKLLFENKKRDVWPGMPARIELTSGEDNLEARINSLDEPVEIEQ